MFGHYTTLCMKGLSILRYIKRKKKRKNLKAEPTDKDIFTHRHTFVNKFGWQSGGIIIT